MEDLMGKRVIVRGSDGWAYEGTLEGSVPRGITAAFRLTGPTRFINWEDHTTDPVSVEWVDVPAPVYVPEHLVSWIHESHLPAAPKAKKKP